MASSGLSGLSGLSGVSGLSGLSGLSGISGLSGLSDLSGISGLSSLSGLPGISGLSGLSAWLSNVSEISGISRNIGPIQAAYPTLEILGLSKLAIQSKISGLSSWLSYLSEIFGIVRPTIQLEKYRAHPGWLSNLINIGPIQPAPTCPSACRPLHPPVPHVSLPVAHPRPPAPSSSFHPPVVPHWITSS